MNNDKVKTCIFRAIQEIQQYHVEPIMVINKLDKDIPKNKSNPNNNSLTDKLHPVSNQDNFDKNLHDLIKKYFGNPF